MVAWDSEVAAGVSGYKVLDLAEPVSVQDAAGRSPSTVGRARRSLARGNTAGQRVESAGDASAVSRKFRSVGIQAILRRSRSNLETLKPRPT
jgi:hypothetical protein